MAIIFSYNLMAAEIEVESYVEQTTIGLMDRLKLTIEISGSNATKVNAPELPAIRNFRNLGYSTGSSSSYKFVNGKAESNITKKFTFSLQPQKSGKFIIPPVQINYKGKLFTTRPITVTVTTGSANKAATSSTNLNRANNNNSTNVEDNLFIKTIVSDKNIFKGEPIIVEYVLYSRYDISNLSYGEDASFKGFWKEELYTPTQISFNTRTYNGMRYNTMKMRTIALYPNVTGKLKIPALEILADIRTQSNSFFDFGNTKRFNVISKPISIIVKQLPTTPANYSGGVGNFTINAKISDDQIKVGDSFTYTLAISGSGNIKQFDIPKLPAINHLRFLDPEISTNLNKNGISGSKTIKYLVIAQEQGNIEIPPISFNFFDSNTEKFRTIKTKPFTLNVAKGDLTYISSSSAQTTVKMEGADIGFLVNIEKLENNLITFKSWGYWLTVLLMLLTIPISFIYKKEQNKLSSNQNYYRSKTANKILRKYMKEATNHAKTNNQQFYGAAQLGLANFLADKMHIPRGSTTEKMVSKLSEKQVPAKLYQQIEQIFETCNQARFMPGGFSSDKIIQHLELLQNAVAELSKLKF